MARLDPSRAPILEPSRALSARPPAIMEISIAGCPNRMQFAAPLSEEDYWRKHNRPVKGWETLSEYEARLRKIYARYLKSHYSKGAKATRRFMIQGRLKLKKEERKEKLAQLKRLNQVRSEAKEVVNDRR